MKEYWQITIEPDYTNTSHDGSNFVFYTEKLNFLDLSLLESLEKTYKYIQEKGSQTRPETWYKYAVVTKAELFKPEGMFIM